MNFLYHKMS